MPLSRALCASLEAQARAGRLVGDAARAEDDLARVLQRARDARLRADALAALVALDNRALTGGAHIVEKADPENPRGSIGHVTAACFSPELGKHIGLALVQGGKKRHGTRAYISDPVRNRFGPVEIVSHHFVDPDGSRMHG